MRTLKQIHKVLLRPNAALHELYHTVYEGTYRHAKKIFFLDLVLILGILGALGLAVFFIFWSPTIEKYIDIKMQVQRSIGGTAEKPLVSGDLIDVKINIKNRSKVEIEKARIDIELPSAFIQISNVYPSEVGKISSGEEKTIMLTGYIFSNPRELQKITAKFFYNQKNSDKTEQKTAILHLEPQGSVFELTEFLGPDKIFPEGKFGIKYKFKAAKKIPMSSFAVKIPEGFTSSKGVDSKGIHVFGVQTQTENFIEEGREFEFETELTLAGSEFVNKKVNALIVPMLQINDYFIDQPFGRPSAPDALAPENKNDKTGEIGFGEIGQIIVLENRFDILAEFNKQEIKGPAEVEVPIVIRSGAFPLKYVIMDLEFPAGVSVDKLVHQELGPMEPESSKTLVYKMKIPKNFTSEGNKIVVFAFSVFEAETGAFDTTGKLNVAKIVGKFGKQKILETSVSSDPALKGQAIYFGPQGDQLGRGPLPPIVGKTTKYWVHWKLDSGSRKLKEAEIWANVPSYASFTGKASVTGGRAPEFDSESQKIMWKAGDIAPNSEIDIYFEIAILPIEAHAGSALRVLGESEGKFTFEDDKLTTVRIEALTTELQDDAIGRESGSKIRMQ